MNPIQWPNLFKCWRQEGSYNFKATERLFAVYNLWQFGCFMLTVTTNKALQSITADIYNHLTAIYNWWQSLTWNVNIGSFSSSALITLIYCNTFSLICLWNDFEIVRGAFKIKKSRNLGKVPNRGRGGHQKFKKFQSFSWEKFKKAGGHHISKKSQVSKTSQVWKIMHYFHLMRTLKQKNLYFFALKMAKTRWSYK